MKKFRIPLIAYDGWKFIFAFGFIGFLFLFFAVRGAPLPPCGVELG